jgi:hypothetical protein
VKSSIQESEDGSQNSELWKGRVQTVNKVAFAQSISSILLTADFRPVAPESQIIQSGINRRAG